MTFAEIFTIIVENISLLTVPLIFFVIIGYGLFKRIRLYESFVEGGKEGFEIFLKILPFLIAIIMAIGLFRQCGALGYLSEMLAPITMLVGMPAEVLPVALMKPLSGGGSLGIVSEIIAKDPNSFEAQMASTMFGSTDTTFYIIALYFGSVGVQKIRHAMVVGLTADVAGILAAVWISHIVFG